jgi:transcription elongation factor Elf1
MDRELTSARLDLSQPIDVYCEWLDAAGKDDISFSLLMLSDEETDWFPAEAVAQQAREEGKVSAKKKDDWISEKDNDLPEELGEEDVWDEPLS